MGRVRGGGSDWRSEPRARAEERDGGARDRHRPLRSAQVDVAVGRRGHVHDRRHAGEPRLRHEDAEAGSRQELDGVARRPHLHLQAARRRQLLQRQEDDRQGRGRDLRALARSGDQGPGEVAHGRPRQGLGARRLHGRVQAQEAVLRAALPDDAVLPHDPEHRAGQAARRRFRRQGVRRHRPLLPGELDTARFDRADQAHGLQVGPADLRLHRGAGRQRGLEGRAGREHARDGAAGRPGRRQPVRALLVAQGADGQQAAPRHQGGELSSGPTSSASRSTRSW